MGVLPCPINHIPPSPPVNRPFVPKIPLAQPPPSPNPEALHNPVTSLKGVDKKTAEKLARLHVHTVRDLLYHFPRYHKEYTRRTGIAALQPGKDTTIVATVREASRAMLGNRGRAATRALVSDKTGELSVVWFNQPYLAKQFKRGRKIALSGRVGTFGGAPVMENPEYDLVYEGSPLINTVRPLPVHPLTRDLYPRSFRRVIWDALWRWAPSVQEFLPQDTLTRLRPMPLPEAVVRAHFPESDEVYEEARRRLAFDELLLLQISVLQRRRQWKDAARGASIDDQTPPSKLS